MPIKGEYYYLEKDDLVQEGDEFDGCENAWHDDAVWVKANHRIGKPVSDPLYPAHTIYRRKIPEVNSNETNGVAHYLSALVLNNRGKNE